MNICDRLRNGLHTATAAETHALAAEFAATLPPDTILALHGDLGVGKTTFVQGLARGLGLDVRVTSPTFNIFTLYRGPRTLIHLDAYRLESDAQIDALMLDDFLISPYCVAVEWPEKISRWLPPGTLHLTLSINLADGTHGLRLHA